MKNKIFNKFKLGLAGSLLAWGLNGCENQKETNNSKSYTSYTLEEHTKEDNLEETLKENESLFIFDAKKIVGKECKFSISTQEYLKYKQMKHRDDSDNDFTEWVTYNDTTIKNIATKLTEKLKSPEKKAQRLLDFAQSHIYDQCIERDRDYIKYPIETIVEHRGDCEDFAILGAALMKSIGIDVALISIPPAENRGAHMALAVNGNFPEGNYYRYSNKKYFYAEATYPFWDIGKIPEGCKTEFEFYLVK